MIIFTYFTPFSKLLYKSVIKLMLIIICLYCVLCDMFKAIIRYNSCRFMRLENVFSYFTFIHTGKLAFIYVRYYGRHTFPNIRPYFTPFVS